MASLFLNELTCLGFFTLSLLFTLAGLSTARKADAGLTDEEKLKQVAYLGLTARVSDSMLYTSAEYGMRLAPSLSILHVLIASILVIPVATTLQRAKQFTRHFQICKDAAKDLGTI